MFALLFLFFPISQFLANSPNQNADFNMNFCVETQCPARSALCAYPRPSGQAEWDSHIPWVRFIYLAKNAKHKVLRETALYVANSF